ncbi:protein FAR1-RELATED SEQUENCE 5-like [Camellia sinensis]|uniref:protein FAR1-RELATED SEQUENCE 5-like n=1 Tax=Camellia sinensis TaxID=4442 RepID=UPI001036DEEF|nr:protein FAR1-RELATED SEQUENCE 5-like [Camellia sinensis]
MDEPESSRPEEVNTEIDDQFALDGKDDVVDVKEGLASQTYDSLRMLTKEDVLQMKFNSEDDAYTFYNAYAKVIGFSVRRSRKRIIGDNKFVESRKWVCSREGVREKKYLQRVERVRTPRAETRLFCNATFRVRYDKTARKYVVTHFVGEHNHPLAAPHCVPFLWSHSQGGYEKVGFIHRDLHNQFQAERKVQLAEGDAEGALGYLSAKLDADPLFFFKYNIDKDNRLDKIFWADCRSRMDYAAFGDKPFVILAGMSNHFMTTIFGCALLPDETMETYTWVLEMLMEAMDGKRPISVVTDGDRAMRQAIKRVIPNCRHRLCSWHLEKNASTNVHIPEFTTDFAQLMLKKCKIDEFDNAWAAMVKQYKLENNNWVSDIHLKRDNWAEAYLRGHMFAGMRSTQRVEGINAYFNIFLNQKVRLYEFVA